MDKKEVVELVRGHSHIVPEFTFDNFVVGSCNELCVTACKAVVNQPGEVYNPLYIHGKTGAGKTHLAHAIANDLVAAGHRALIIQNAEIFVNELIAAIRSGTLHKFREQYRKADALIIEDIQFMAGKEKSQQEFFHTFNGFYELKKQIVLTSNNLPNGMNNFASWLRSRFSSGLVEYIPPPNLDTRLAFISRKAELAGVTLENEVAELLVSHISCDFRMLAGALTKLIFHAAQAGKPIDLNFANHVLKDQFQNKA